MDHFIISLLATCLSTFVIGLAQADCFSWTKEAEDNICALVTDNDLAFCSSPGAADGNCTNLTAAVSGSDPQCVDTQVCQFSLNGGTAYVSCNATKPGYEISKNCAKNFGIACPKTSADLSDPSRMINITGKDGCGSHEATSLTDHQICNMDSDDSVCYCESQTLRDDIIKNFHPDKRIGDLCGGVCMNIRNSTDETNYKEVVRCVFAGTFYSDETGHRDLCRFHLYNQGKKISIVAYWGTKNLLRLEDVV